MVKLRLIPTGKSIQPSFRVVAIDARTRLNGKYIDILGIYDPIKKTVKLNEELTLKHLMTGAQPTDTVRNLLSKQGIMTKFHNLKQDQKKTKQKTVKTKKVAQSKKEKVAKPKTELKKVVVKKIIEETSKKDSTKTTKKD